MYDNDNDKSTLILFLILVPALLIFLMGSYNGKNTTIKYCIEQPKECKIQYDYLKLQENQK